MAVNYFHVQTIIILINIILGYVVWTYNSKSYLNRILTLIIMCILLVDVSLLFNLKIEEKRFLFASIISGSLGISFFPPLLYTLSLYYPIKKFFAKKHLIALYGISLFLSLLIIVTFPGDYVVNKIVLPATIQNISLKKLPLVFVTLYFLLSSYSIVLLVLTTRNFLSSFKADLIPYEKQTIRMLIVIGLPLAYFLSLVSVVNYFFNIPFPWIGFLLAAFTLFSVILVFRFHLVDVKRLVNGMFFFPSLIAILVFIYFYFILSNQHKIAYTLALPENVTLVLEVFIIYMAVSTLRRLLDIPFMKKRFPNISLFRTVTVEPLEYLSYSHTLKDLSRRLQKVFHVYNRSENSVLLLLDREKQQYMSIQKSRSLTLNASSELIKVLLKLNRGVTLEELSTYMNNRRDIRVLHSTGINLILPIKKENEIIALLLMPKKGILQRWNSEDIYSLNYIRVIMPSLIDRCTMYESEKEIEKHHYRMEQLMVMGQMASGLAHEIRNPLSIISTSVETIMKDDILEEDKRKMLQYIQEEADRINILATKLLSINFQKRPELEYINLAALFQKLKAFLQYQLKDKDISFSIKNDEPFYLYSDPNILFQIALNLSLNSIEAMSGGGFLAVDYQHNRTIVSIFMEDNGPGIPDTIRDKIFEPFFTTKKKGSGLGLTVTEKLIKTLYGSIELLPSKKGAHFKLTLPLLKAQGSQV